MRETDADFFVLRCRPVREHVLDLGSRHGDVITQTCLCSLMAGASKFNVYLGTRCHVVAQTELVVCLNSFQALDNDVRPCVGCTHGRSTVMLHP